MDDTSSHLHTGPVHSTGSRFYGRQSELDAIDQGGSMMTVLVGDSGVGKSALLARYKENHPRSLISDAVTVRSGPAALQRALVEALTKLLDGILKDPRRSFKHRKDNLTRYLRQARGAGNSLLRTSITALIADAISARIGETAGSLVTNAAGAWNENSTKNLWARLKTVPSDDTIDVLMRIADDISVLADATLTLVFDDLHNLTDEDNRRLHDLLLDTDAAAAPKTRLLASFTVVGRPWTEGLERLRRAGAEVVHLEPLPDAMVRQWLQGTNIPAKHFTRVIQLTNGYPFHLRDAITLANDNPATLDSHFPNALFDVVTAATRMAYNSLDDTQRRQVLLLSAFDHRLDDSDAEQYLGISSLDWQLMRALFVERGIFIDRGDETWFHELRRNRLWLEFVNPDLRKIIAAQAVLAIEQQVRSTRDYTADKLRTFARLIPLAGDAIEHSPTLEELMACLPSSLAIMAALMETSVPSREDNGSIFPGFVAADSLLIYASDTYLGNMPDDFSAELVSLHESQLVAYSVNERAGVVAPLIGDLRSRLFLAGRCVIQFDRLPIPQAAQAVVDMLDPYVHSPVVAAALHGRASIIAMSQQANKLYEWRRVGDGLVRRQSGPNVIARGSLGVSPWSFIAAFDEVEDAVRTVADLRQAEGSTWGQDLTVTDAVIHPLEAVKSRRFVKAAEHLLGIDIERVTGSSDATAADWSHINLETEMHLRARILEEVFERSSQLERWAYNLERGRGVAFWADQETTTEISRVHESHLVYIDGRRGVHRLPASGIGGDDAFAFLRASQALGVREGEQVTRLVHRLGAHTKNPLIEEIVNLSQSAGLFNKEQRGISLPWDESLLSDQLSAGIAEIEKDALAMAACIPPHVLQGNTPAPLSLRILLSEREPEAAYQSRWYASWALLSPEAGDNRASVRIVSLAEGAATLEMGNFETGPLWLETVFGLAPGHWKSWGLSPVKSVLAEWLGFQESDVLLPRVAW